MTNYSFAQIPWGPADWVIGSVGEDKEWSIVSCLSPEERCLAVTQYFDSPSSAMFVEVIERESPYFEDAHAKLDSHKKELLNRYENVELLENIDLMSSPIEWNREIENYIDSTNKNIVLDISCFPKRFFFLILKELLLNDAVDNLLVAYSSPREYYKGDLAEEALANNYLPTFQATAHPPEEPEVAIVGVGFMPFTMPDDLKAQYGGTDIVLFFPFPSPAPEYQRSWEFLREVENVFQTNHALNICRISPYDAANCFEHIKMLTNFGEKTAIFAPHGPKPQSMSMCLYSALTSSQVVYTQPTVYRHDYSIGIAKKDGKPDTKLYCIKIDGKKLCNLEK